ncbi:LysR family transcriptional regulator [Taklimakanibacter deserti]|uniref:LysR family transcriptional regulator n=1 Tax=Taklimakanibacter deserti TaxID=2267839 RepID=UPI000E649800
MSVLDIEVLRTFQAIARFGQFRAASLHLNKSPSAISAHVRRFEEMAGGRVFERDNQGVSLTPLGRGLLIKAAELLEAHDRIVRSFDGSAESERLRLGVPEDFARALLRDVLDLFCGEYPRVELEVITASCGELRHEIRKGSLDLGLILAPSDDAEAKDFVPVLPSRLVWVGAVGFKPASSEPVPLALHADGCPYRAAAIEVLAKQGRAWRCVMMSSGSAAVEAAIEFGLAVGVVERMRVTKAMQMLGESDGFPSLPEHGFYLLRGKSAPGKVQLFLEELILKRFRP